MNNLGKLSLWTEIFKEIGEGGNPGIMQDLHSSETAEPNQIFPKTVCFAISEVHFLVYKMLDFRSFRPLDPLRPSA